uniref:Putative tick kunitz 30 n=1 Tax=Ixodes ricinus TaxID=34613 RepID=V5H6Y4_IXORI
MKAIIAFTCVFSAVMLTSALLDKTICEGPHAVSMCATDDVVETFYYFDNNTRQCQQEIGCGNGPNKFPNLETCEKECPYGNYEP